MTPPVTIARSLLPTLALCAVAALLFADVVQSRRVLGDEQAYTCAFDAVARGVSPYTCPRYLYPPAAAELGSALAAGSSVHAVLVGVRLLNVAAAVFIVHFSMAFVPLGPWVSVVIGSLVLALSPNLKEGLGFGNVSPLVSAMLLWALSRWPRAPILAGVVLGTSIAMKPVGAVALLLLLVHRPTIVGPRQLWAALVATATLGAWMLPWAGLLPEMLGQPFAHREALHNVSIQRLAFLLGSRIPAGLVFAAVTAAFTLYVRRRPRSATELLHSSCAASLLSTPAVWCHSLVLLYPTIGAACARAMTRPALPGARGPWSTHLELLAVAMPSLWLLQSDVFGDLSEHAPPVIAVLLTFVPVALPTVLALYATGALRRLDANTT